MYSSNKNVEIPTDIIGAKKKSEQSEIDRNPSYNS